MTLHNKSLAIYYHMPFMVKDGLILSNPVIGTFIESLLPYFKKIIVLGFEIVGDNDAITYPLPRNPNLEFVNLGPEGQFWDYFQKMSRLKRAIKSYKRKIHLLLLRVPSHLAYAVWKFLGQPQKNVLMFIGNPFFTPAYSNTRWYLYLFRKLRSDLHDFRMERISKNSSPLVLANSPALVDLWSSKLRVPVDLIHTSSISEKAILTTNSQGKFSGMPYKLLFVGRVCFDKGIRELFQALGELNKKKEGVFTLDIVGAMGDLGGNSIDQLINEFDILEYVQYHGVVPFGEKILSYYRNADAYILPSYHEGMPKTVWEAMSQGTPVIASEIDGLKYNFTHQQDILFIKPRDPATIYDAVLMLCESQELVKTLQDSGLERSKTMTKETQAERITRLIKRKWDN